jgi:hypothetical protein
VRGCSDELRAYLAEAGRRPFRWGECDCFLFAADWVLRVTGRDPAGAWRGGYADERTARRLMKAHGGPLALAQGLLAAAGCEETKTPGIGDVALVKISVRRGRWLIAVPAGAILVRADMWAVKCAGASLAIGRFPLIRAWTLPNG